MQDYKKWLVERFIIERKRFDRSGVYAYTPVSYTHLTLPTN